MSKKTILHVSYDLRRDANRSPLAVRNFISGSERNFGAIIVSLHRIAMPFRNRVEAISERELEIDHFGLPLGIMMSWNLRRVSRMVLATAARGLLDLSSIDIVHAHKMTFEGIAGSAIARELGRPFVVSIRATDAMVLRFRWDLRPLVRRILKQCEAIFYVAPYIKNEMRRYLGSRFYEVHVAGKMVFLPNCVTRKTAHHRIVQARIGSMLTILRMDAIRDVRNKNIKRLLKALAELKERDVHLDIIGDGPCRPVMERWARKYGVEHRVSFLGYIPNDALGIHYTTAQAFLLPSISETFGLVYAEALLHGTPLLYSASTGFDGIFENVGVAVNARSVRSIASGIRELLVHNREYRSTIRRLMDEGAFEIFDPKYPQRVYLETVTRNLL